MMQLNVGNTFDLGYLQKIIKLNQRHSGIKVTEMYGSVSNILCSVRPSYRVPERSKSFIGEYIQEANEHGIEINYTYNRSCCGHIKNIWNNRYDIQKEIDYLVSLGIKRFTVASPLLIEYFNFPKIEISTIFNQMTLKQIYELGKLSKKIDKICMPIYLNRNFTDLKRAQECLKRLGIKLELIVNEFCAAEGGTCVRRSECYNLQSHGGNREKYFDNYPVGKCIKARAENPVNWLKAPFILPQWLKIYEASGIEHFKITGRTHSSESTFKIVSLYMEQSFNGSLCELWGISLEKVYGEFGYYPVDIPVKKIENFLQMFMSTPEHSCLSEVCGIDCNYCNAVYQTIKKEMNNDEERKNESSTEANNSM